MITKCSNCNRDLGKTACEKDQHLKISHGICSHCIESLYKDDFNKEELSVLVNNQRQKENNLILI